MIKTEVLKKENKTRYIATIIAVISIVLGALAIYVSAYGGLKTVKELKVEYGTPLSVNVEDYLLEDFAKENKEILKDIKLEILKNELVDKESYQKIGTYTVELTYKERKYSIKVNVQDTTKPSFIDFKESIETYIDVVPKYKSVYKAEDLSKVKVSVSDENVDYSKEGKYTAVITATDSSNNSINKEIKVEVKKPTIEFEKETLQLTVGENAILATTIKGKENKAVYESSDSSVLTVDENGKVTAIKEGTSTITATANDVADKCVVTVIKKPSNNNSSGGSSRPAANSKPAPVVTNYPAGKGITLTKFQLNNPALYDFGEFQDEAQQIYDAIINKNTNGIYLIIPSKGYSDLRNKVEKIILEQSRVCVIPKLVEEYDDDTIKIFYETKYLVREYHYGELSYNACVSAGLYNGMLEGEAVVRINNWICNKMTYVINGTYGYEAMLTGQGACYAYSDMFKAMCDRAGIQCKIEIGSANGVDGWSGHAWNIVTINGIQYHVDVTWNDAVGNKYLFATTLWSDHSPDL